MDTAYYREYFELERNHWWFKARLEILEKLVGRAVRRLPAKTTLRILNAGVATGATTRMLEKFGNVTSLEYDRDCCHFLRETLKIDVVQGSLTELPFPPSTFDLVCAFDVIEHIQNDQLALREIHRVTVEGGLSLYRCQHFNSYGVSMTR
jgi:SAM-dependent methyltransferase